MLTQTAFAQELLTTAQAQKEQYNSLKYVQDVANRIRINFKTNPLVQRYLYQDLYYFQLMRLNETETVFPRVNNHVKGYNEQYNTLTTEYILKLDEAQVTRMKNFVDAYCKQNSYKDAEPCSAQRVEAVFAK